MIHDQIEDDILDEKLRCMFQGLLIEGVQDRMPCLISRGAGALCLSLAEMSGHTTEGTLIDTAVFGAREWHAVVFQFDDGRCCFPAHVLDGVLIPEPVGPFDGVVHVPTPVICPHVAQCSADAALSRHGMAAGRKNFG